MTNEELVRRRVEAINTGDFEALGEVLAPDVITHYGSGEAVHGLEALGDLLAGFSAFSDLIVTIDDLAVDGDRVGARYTSRGRQQAEFLGIPNTGATVDFQGAGIHRIQDGKIAEVWTVDDWAALSRQLRSKVYLTTAPELHGVCEASAETVTKNKQAIAHWIDLTNAHAFERLSEVWAQDVAVRQSNDVEEIVGLDPFIATLRMFYRAMPDLEIVLEDLVGEGNIVFMRTSSRATHKGELFGIAATDRTVQYNGIATYYLDDGKITHEWFNDDMFTLMSTISSTVGSPLPQAS